MQTERNGNSSPGLGSHEAVTPQAPVPTTARASDSSDRQLEIALLFTSPEATVGALKRTAALLYGLNARINLVAVQAVPYPLALNNPPVSVTFTERRLRDIARESPMDTTAHLYICRNPLYTLTSILRPGSVLIVGTQKTWWPTWERKLARRLESAGLQIILLKLDRSRAVAGIGLDRGSRTTQLVR